MTPFAVRLSTEHRICYGLLLPMLGWWCPVPQVLGVKGGQGSIQALLGAAEGGHGSVGVCTWR